VPQWKIVKLELAPGGDYPKGSPAMAFLLRVPLDRAGMIDECALVAQPKGAFARRFWLNEPDRSGVVRHDEGGWALQFPGGERNARLDHVPMMPEAVLELAQADGTRLRFRVVSIEAD
jgi:hypothetical protein